MIGEKHDLINRDTAERPCPGGAKFWLFCLEAINEFIAVAAFIGFFVCIVAQVMYRYLGVNLTWSEELARVLNIWTVFLGAAVVYRQEEHIRIDIIDRFLIHKNKKIKTAFALFADVFCLLFVLVLLTGSLVMAVSTWDVYLSSLTGWRTSYLYFAPALGAFFMLLYIIIRMVSLVKILVED